jgi:uncharacterized membrane protein YhdT
MHAKRDEALEWEGDEPADVKPAVLPEGWEAVGKGSEKVSHEKYAADGVAPAQLSAPALLTIGLLAGVYLLYSIGWVVVGFRIHDLGILEGAAYWFAVVCSVAAPLLWFVATWVLTRKSKGWVRIAGLVGGVALLVPWPFVTFGAAGVI